MKVHLLRFGELDIAKYLNVVNLLRQFKGTIEFMESEFRLLHTLEKDIPVVLSRIKRKLSAAVGQEVLSIFQIEGPHGGDHRIALEREFVSIEGFVDVSKISLE